MGALKALVNARELVDVAYNATVKSQQRVLLFAMVNIDNMRCEGF